MSNLLFYGFLLGLFSLYTTSSKSNSKKDYTQFINTVIKVW